MPTGGSLAADRALRGANVLDAMQPLMFVPSPPSRSDKTLLPNAKPYLGELGATTALTRQAAGVHPFIPTATFPRALRQAEARTEAKLSGRACGNPAAQRPDPRNTPAN
jgi:hypothetical protein